MLLTTQTQVQRWQTPKPKIWEKTLSWGRLCTVRKRPLRQAPREWVKGPRQLQKQVVLGGEPCKEESKWTSEEQSSKDSIVGELSVFVLFCLFFCREPHFQKSTYGAMHQFCKQWITMIWYLLCLFKLSCGSHPPQRRPTFSGPHSNLCLSIWIPVKTSSAEESGSKFYHPSWRPVVSKK